MRRQGLALAWPGLLFHGTEQFDHALDLVAMRGRAVSIQLRQRRDPAAIAFPTGQMAHQRIEPLVARENDELCLRTLGEVFAQVEGDVKIERVTRRSSILTTFVGPPRSRAWVRSAVGTRDWEAPMKIRTSKDGGTLERSTSWTFS